MFVRENFDVNWAASVYSVRGRFRLDSTVISVMGLSVKEVLVLVVVFLFVLGAPTLVDHPGCT